MRTITLWKWRYRLRGKLITTRHLLTEEDAQAQLSPDAERIEWTREDRRVPDSEEERQQLRTGRLAGKPD